MPLTTFRPPHEDRLDENGAPAAAPRCPRARVNAFIHTWPRDPDNNLMIEQAEWCDELARSGEIFLALVARIDDSVVVRAVPASRTEKVDWEPGDYRAETMYHEVRDRY